MSNEESSVEESVTLERDSSSETVISPDVLRKERQRLVIKATPYTSQIRKPKCLTDDQFADILYTFTLLDANKDGRLSRHELKKGAFLMGMNPTDSELRAWWKVTDKNNDGFIDVYEYLDVMKSNFNTLDIEKERLMTAFRVIDKKGDGRILKKDFISILTCNNSCITREEADKMFTEADSLGKGYIGYEGMRDTHMSKCMTC
uniref:Calmodulin n=1 Tax=Magallana gigas TaxID=29159 RepID=K1RBA9_MAGGI